ncbi:MAG: TetR/AcrR family transcriptional regulator [Eubacteriales bacterium]|nr:TetR/AcrR family transcriptional regulator [Eubacteriales bacterium]
MRQIPKNVSPMSNRERNAYVIRHLTDASLTLLREKPLSEISVSELCDTAGVGRASFYRNFENKEDILKAYINQLFSEWISEYEQNSERPLSDLIQSLFAHFERHRDVYSLLQERNLIFLLKDVLIGILGPKPEHTAIEAYSRAYVAYTLYGWIEVWFQRGMKESAQEIAGLFRMQQL